MRRPAQPVPPHRYTGSPVIGPISAGDVGKKTLVLDLDETLVHSSFKPIPNPDYIIPVRAGTCCNPSRCQRSNCPSHLQGRLSLAVHVAIARRTAPLSEYTRRLGCLVRLRAALLPLRALDVQ